jgi:hypothetical protein
VVRTSPFRRLPATWAHRITGLRRADGRDLVQFVKGEHGPRNGLTSSGRNPLTLGPHLWGIARHLAIHRVIPEAVPGTGHSAELGEAPLRCFPVF